jgi:predicted MFS family arabinose efflux permease
MHVANAALPRRQLLLLLVLSGTIISICMGLRQSLGLFVRPMTVDLGITAASFGLAIAVQNLVWGLSQPFLGALADRHGARPVLLATAFIYAAGLVLMAFSRSIAGALQVAGFLAGVGIAGTGFGVLIGAVSRAVPSEQRTRTVGIVAAAGSIGTFVIAPLGQHLIDGFGWRPAMLSFAALAASIALMALVLREPHAVRPPQARPAGGGAVRDALTHRGYLMMTLAFFACGFQLVFLSTYLPSYLQVCGVAPGVAARALGVIGLCNAAGTYLFGVLGARFSQKHLLAAIYLLRTVTIVVFLRAPISEASTLAFAAAMGFLWLGVVPLVSGIIGRVFGMGRFNTLYGLVFLSHQLGSFAGAWMGGAVFDRFGSYDYGWAALIGVGLGAFVLQWLMDERPPRHRAPAAVPLPA